MLQIFISSVPSCSLVSNNLTQHGTHHHWPGTAIVRYGKCVNKAHAYIQVGYLGVGTLETVGEEESEHCVVV